MKSENRNAKLIFGEALRLSVPAERAAYLDQACAEDLALRQEVESLLSAHAQAGDFLNQTCPLPAPDLLIEHAGTRIGRYKLLEQIGEGGFGVVWMAEQEEPVRRRVALKIIKLGMDTKEVVARFEAERQALALMDHPGIANILDAGATDAGRPYFVMELVNGIPITHYCDRKKLPTAERLHLFMKVCHAVQHAHQKGIIHRDLKPTNVLVTLHDGQPVPKVIDFGVAKALGQKLTEKTLFTGFQQMIGTPAYMSPEQAEMSGLDVDTRSDIYSLGVLLYELLTGVTPFDKETLARVALDEIRRMIRETEPLKPSTRLRTLGDELAEVAKRRHAEPAALNRLVQGDLDWIVMKCLEKDRTRRYETANGLAADLERHVNDEPVVAGPPTAGYRLRKFVHRHRAAVAAVAGFVALLALASVVSTGLALWANRERTNAQRAERAAKETLTQLRIQEAEQFFSANDSSTALSSLARELRDNPSNRAAAERLVSALTQRNFPLPADGPRRHVHVYSTNVQGAQAGPRGGDVWSRVDSRTLFEFAINASEFSPDGRLVLTASDDKTAQVWDALTLQPRSPPLQHSSHVLSALFSPDSRQVLTVAENDAAAYIWESWDNPKGQPRRKALKHGAKVNHAEFSLDGRWVLTASDDKTARVWDAHTGEQSGQPLIHNWGVWRAGFSPDARFAFTVAWDGGYSQSASLSQEDRKRFSAERVTLWDVQTSQPLNRPSAWQNASTVEFSPDGQRVLVSTRVFDARTGVLIPGFKYPEHDEDILFAKFSPDGQRFVTGSEDKTARLWDAHTGQPLTSPLEHGDQVVYGEFSLDGQQLVTVSNDGIIRIWDPMTGRLLSEVMRGEAGVTGGPYLLGSMKPARFSPDGQHLLVADGMSVQVWDIRVGNALIESIPGANKFSPTEGDVMLVSPWNGQCQTWNVREMRPLSVPFGYAKRVPTTNAGWGLAYNRLAQFSLDGRLVSTIERNTVGVWDAHTGKQMHGPIPLEGVPETVEFPGSPQTPRFLLSPDGLAIYAATKKELKIWDSRTGQIRVKSLLPRGDLYTPAEVSPDGGLLAMKSYTCEAFRVWDARTGRLAAEPYGYNGDSLLYRTWPSPRGGPGPFECGAEQLRSRFSPDGKRLVTAHADGSAWIWDSRTGRVLAKLLKHGGRVSSASFSADGRYVVTASDDKTARVWDSHTGEPVMAPLKHQSAVEMAEFSRDGQRIVTAAKDSTVRLWDAHTGLALTEPRQNQELYNDAEFSSDGSWVYIHANGAGCWDTALVPSPAPGWLPELAEAIAGSRLTSRRISQTVPEGRLLELKDQLAMRPGEDYYSRWVRWFFADRSTRTISPQSATTLPQYVQRRMEAGQFDSLREVVRLSPSNGLAVARLSKRVQDGYPYSRDETARLGEADFLSRHAVKLAPQDAEVAKIRAEIAERIKNLPKP